MAVAVAEVLMAPLVIEGKEETMAWVAQAAALPTLMPEAEAEAPPEVLVVEYPEAETETYMAEEAEQQVAEEVMDAMAVMEVQEVSEEREERVLMVALERVESGNTTRVVETESRDATVGLELAAVAMELAEVEALNGVQPIPEVAAVEAPVARVAELPTQEGMEPVPLEETEEEQTLLRDSWEAT